MKSRFKVIVALLCTLALAVTPMFAAWGDTSSGEMAASNVVYKGEPGTKGIKSFTLDGKFKYKSATDDNTRTLTPTKSALQDIARNNLLPQWSGVATAVFRDQANQLVDLYGYKDLDGMMSQDGFDAYYNMSASGNDTYKDETWSCYSLKSKLEQTYSTHSGDPGWDQLTVSGLKQFSSLQEARKQMGQALYDCEGHKGLSADEFIGTTDGDESRLSALDDDSQRTVFANVVTSVNCKGSSSNFDYVAFGIAFYDFEAVPVAAHGLQYVSGSVGMAEDTGGENVSTISNGQQQSIIHSAVLGNDVKETTSTTISALASAKVDQSIGANMSWSETQSGSDTSIGAGGDEDNPSIEVSTSGWSESTTMGLNWGATWGLAAAAGAEMGHSQENQISKAVSTSIELPAHTSAGITHNTTKTTYAQRYQQPVILNYKVAIFAISGDYYTGGSGGINDGIYDKQSLVIKFDTKDSASPSYGCAATDDLYSRAVTNIRVDSYDTADGRTYETHCDKRSFKKRTDIDWGSVINYANQKNWGSILEAASTNLFYETPGKLEVVRDKTSSTVNSIYPLYGLSYVETPKTEYVLYTGNTLDRKALAVQGYNQYGTPFYGFNSQWGEWNRCDENGTVINGGLLKDDDPVFLTDQGVIAPKAGTEGGTIYLKWFIEDENAKPVTGESPNGQNLAASNISSPVVKINVVNSRLDNPSVTAEGSYTGYRGTSVNLNNVMSYLVKDDTDRIIETQVRWNSQEPTSYGINVDESTGNVTFTKPGTYHVRPYIINNSNKAVVPFNSDGSFKWLTITATEHDLTHYDATAPTCTADGCREYYKCSDCGKYFSDAAGTTVISESDIIIEAIGHNWSEWTTTKELTDNAPGEQRRVCSNDASHVETRNLCSVKFNMNGHGEQIPDQAVASGMPATEPAEPTEAGFAFGGWFTDSACSTPAPYDFGTAVESNLTLYAKWSVVKHTVAAIGVSYDINGNLEEDDPNKVKVAHNDFISIVDGATATETIGDDNYKYYYKVVDYGTPVTLKVSPDNGYGLKNLEAIPVSSDKAENKSFTPTKTGANTYTLTVTDSDIAVVASFSKAKVTFDGNAPANAEVTNVPDPQEIPCGNRPTQPAVNPEARGAAGATYQFDGWYTDKNCTEPYRFDSAITEDTTLYAKWIQTTKDRWTVTYKLYDVGNPNTELYKYSYQVTDGDKAYDPTDDLYAAAGKDILAGYELYSANNSCWFTDSGLTDASAFDFATPIGADTTLHARAVPRTFTVKFFDGKAELGAIENIAYNTPIGATGFAQPTATGSTFSGWATEDGVPWNIETNPVTSDLDLYASWAIQRCTVSFNANAPDGTTASEIPTSQTIDYYSSASDPGAPKVDGYTFGGWFTSDNEGATLSDTPYDFENTPVKSDLTLYAKWTINNYTVTFDANGHGTAPDAKTVEYGGKAERPADLEVTGYTFGGWFTRDNNGTMPDTPYDFENTPVTSDLTLYAKWTAEEYSITNSAMTNGSVTAHLDGSTDAVNKAPCDSTVTLKVSPSSNYGLTTIRVATDAAEPQMIALEKVDSSTYTFTMPASNVNVSAEFAQVTVSFVVDTPAGGGTVLNQPPNQTIAYGTAPAEPTPEPAVSGGTVSYGFAGWFTDENRTTLYLLTPITKDTTLYAKWVERDKSRTVTYTLYDIEGSNPESYRASALIKHGDAAHDATDYVNNLLKENAEYYTGYEIYTDASGHAWFTDENCTTPYNFSSRVIKDIQLYAKIVPKTYTVTYYSAGPNNADSKVLTTAPITHGTAIGNNAPKPTMDGRILNSWNTADGKHWDLTAPVTGNLTLYADWNNNKYAVTFEANGHGTAPGAQTVEYGETVEQPEDLTATGYTFRNWCTDPECTKVYDFKATVASDLRLYANWTAAEYNVVFDTNGAGPGPATQTVVHGGKATEPAAPTLKDKFFGGWFADAACDEAYDFATPVMGDLTLFASWIDSHTVTFDANGHGTAPAAQTVEDNKQATDPGALTAEGYTFGGWFTDQACTKAYDFTTQVKGDLTLYAKWTANEYTATFDANGHGTAPAAQTVTYGSTLKKPTDPTTADYTFGGWFTDKACTKAYDFATPVTADINLYAKWTKNISDISKAQVTLDQTNYTYDGKAKKPAVKSVVLDGKTLTAGADYDVSYSNNVKAGTATVTVTGKGNYSGTVKVTFTIKAATAPAKTSIAKAKVTLAKKSYIYNGKAKKPGVKSVVLKGKRLKAGTDYTVSYKNNKKVGTATAIVTGKGNYKGSAKATFKIKLGKAKISTAGYMSTSSFDASWKKVKGAKKYQLQYKQVGGKWKTLSVKGTNKTVGSLKAGKLYQFRVRAVSGKQKGAWSKVSKRYFRSVGNVSAKVRKAGTVTAKWKADSKANAGYAVTVRYKKGGAVVAKANVSKGKTKVTVKDLSANRKLWVEVRPLRKSGGKTYSGVQYGTWAKALSGKSVKSQSVQIQQAQGSGLTAAKF